MRRFRFLALSLLLGAAVVCVAPASANAQSVEADRRVRVVSGQSMLIQEKTRISRLSVADPTIADAIVISPYEVQINAKEPGSTTLILWMADGERRLWIIESEVDATRVARMLDRLFPDVDMTVESVGNAVVIAGEVESTVVKSSVEDAVKALGVPVISNLRIPAPRQIMLQVRFAEVSRSAIKELGNSLLEIDGAVSDLDGAGLKDLFSNGTLDVSLSDVVSLAIFDPRVSLSTVIRALSSNGTFRSLAEPNLIAMEGEEAQFLAGGEFPFPMAGGDGQMQIQWKEYGVRLRFKADVGDQGEIHLEVAPEVSSLDFGNSIEASGFRIPSILARRAETTVELRDGQTFAIAGLLDHELTRNAEKFPLLGSIPILGTLFRSDDVRERRSELLVLVTPRLVSPSYVAPDLPGGEASSWEWSRSMRRHVTPKKDAPRQPAGH